MCVVGLSISYRTGTETIFLGFQLIQSLNLLRHGYPTVSHTINVNNILPNQ